jgi:peptidoglycan hydrolase-like protein with peptidoglycan-binding domain
VFQVRSRIAVRFVLPMAIAVAGIAPAAAQASVQRLGSRTLREGMSGSDVKTLQSDLTKVGLTTAETGFFGTQTLRNVKTFETSYDLAANGAVGSKFVSELKSVLASQSPNALAATGSGGAALTIHKQTKTTDPTDIPIVKQNGGSAHLGNRTLRPGMKGHDVRVLQGYLTLVGYPTTVDGDYGPATKANVLAFQVAHDMKANGIVTFAETLVLRQAVATMLATPPVGRTRINPNGTATAPASAPAIVQKVVAAANQIIDKPYIYAGGHASWKAAGYDCSGSVSYALHGGGLLSSPEDSTGLESWGSPGPGKWITVYADAQHTFLVVAGRAFDTADFGGPNIPSGTGPRWRSNPTGNLADGGDYIVRHPAGL